MEATSSNQYIPAGSYQITCSNIRISLSAECVLPNGRVVPSELNFTQKDTKTIGDIANLNGVLTIVPGNGSYPNSEHKLGPFFPAGTYQSSTGDVKITLSADCLQNGGGSIQSWLNYDTSTNIKDIYNDNGTLKIRSN